MEVLLQSDLGKTKEGLTKAFAQRMGVSSPCLAGHAMAREAELLPAGDYVKKKTPLAVSLKPPPLSFRQISRMIRASLEE
jgi:hypothetical protein